MHTIVLVPMFILDLYSVSRMHSEVSCRWENEVGLATDSGDTVNFGIFPLIVGILDRV